MKLTAIKSLEYTPHFKEADKPERWLIQTEKTSTIEMSEALYEMVYRFCQLNPELDCFKDKVWVGNAMKCVAAQMKIDGYDCAHDHPLTDIKFVAKMREHFAQAKEEKKAYNAAHKAEVKAEAEARKQQRLRENVCLLNGKEEPIGGWTLEGSSFFPGRGNCPVKGYWKPAAKLSDLTINWISNKPAPQGQWKVDSDPKRHSIATYEIGVGIPGEKPLRTAQKKIMFGAASSVKDESNKKKYASSADLEKYYNKIMKDCTAKISAPLKNKKEWSIALAEYILFSTGIRIGHGAIKNKYDDNGTKGLVDLIYGDDIKVFKSPMLESLLFDFLGKDSVRNTSTLKVPAGVVDTIQKNWKAGELMFNFTKADLVNEVKKIAKGVAFTPKLARTMVANHVMKDALRKAAKKLNENSTDAEKKLAFDEANMEVAKALNHQKGVSKQAEEKAKERFAAQQEKLKERAGKVNDRKAKVKDNIKKIDTQIDALTARLAKANTKEVKQVLKERIAKANERKAKMKASLSKAQKSLSDNKNKLAFQKENRNLAAGTSKTAYIDPEFVKEWCAEVGLALDKVYNKTQIANFKLED